MRLMMLILGLSLLQTSCTEQQAPVQSIPIQWLSKGIHPESLIPRMNQYVMKDSLGNRVGAMSFTFYKDENHWLAIDTSLFDDGSIYETAEMKFDLVKEAFGNLKTEMTLPNAKVLINLNHSENRIAGKYEVSRDTAILVNRQLDSAYVFDVFREEIYMMLHSISLDPGDSLAFRMFLSNNLSVVPSSIYYEKEERIKVGAGEFDCSVVYLNTGGIIDNRIWIANTPERKLVKFYVPGPELHIELVNSESPPGL